MKEISVPGFGDLEIQHLVLDYNGTLACDGKLLGGVKELLAELAGQLDIHILTADTFGMAAQALDGVSCALSIVSAEKQDVSKQQYVEKLGPEKTVCIGNGLNDRLMLQEAALGIAVIQEEGAAVETLVAADIVAPDIGAALRLLTNPLRTVATLRC